MGRVWGVVRRRHERIVLGRGKLIRVQRTEGGTRGWGHSWKTESSIHFHVRLVALVITSAMPLVQRKTNTRLESAAVRWDLGAERRGGGGWGQGGQGDGRRDDVGDKDSKSRAAGKKGKMASFIEYNR